MPAPGHVGTARPVLTISVATRVTARQATPAGTAPQVKHAESHQRFYKYVRITQLTIFACMVRLAV